MKLKTTIQLTVTIEYDHSPGEDECRYHPGSDSETVITSVKFAGLELIDRLTESELADLQTLVEEDAESQIESAKEDAAISRYESRMECCY